MQLESAVGVENGRIWCDKSVGQWRREKGGGLIGEFLSSFVRNREEREREDRFHRHKAEAARRLRHA